MDPGYQGGSGNEDTRHGNHGDSDGDSSATSSILDFQDWRTIMAEAKRHHDAELDRDEAYRPEIEPESSRQHVARRPGSSEIDEGDEDEERSKTPP